MDTGRPRGDLWENCIWEDSVTMAGSDLYLFQSIHQESDVIPANVDAVRALAGDDDKATSMATTDETLGVGLESLFGGTRRRVVPREADD